jgi:hypothetical protein
VRATRDWWDCTALANARAFDGSRIHDSSWDTADAPVSANWNVTDIDDVFWLVVTAV